MIQVFEVKTKKQQKEFVNFPIKLYDGNPSFVPPLYSDEMSIFKKNYVYNDTCDHVYFNAYMDGKIVGRISGIIQKVSNELAKEKRVRFTRFDSIDNQEVANELFKACEAWAKEKGMDTICGPLGFSDLEREGLLVEGFNEPSTFEEQYNYEYYPKLIENYGFKKEIDWLEHQLRAPKEVDEHFEDVANKLLERYNLHIAKCKNTKQLLKKYADGIFHVLDEAYEPLYGTVPFSEGMKQMTIKNFGLIINIKNVCLVCDENDQAVAFGFCMPSISKVVQKSKGHLTLPALFGILKEVKNPEILDLCLIGVLPEYTKKGIGSYIIAYLLKMLRESKTIKYCETNLNLENNHNILNQWKRFDCRTHKRRRSYVKQID